MAASRHCGAQASAVGEIVLVQGPEPRDGVEHRAQMQLHGLYSRPLVIAIECRDDGFIVISVMHPAMMLKGVQARFTDPRSGQEVRPQSVANRISDYVMGVVSAGLRVIEASEHDAGPDLVARAPRARKYLGWPLLFLMKLAR